MLNPESPQTSDADKEKAPFNSAIATLMRLDTILTQIKDLVMNKDYDRANRQIKKHCLVKEFFIQSYPLLDKEIRVTIKQKLKDFKLVRRQGTDKYHSNLTGQWEYYIHPIFSEEKEDELNDIIMSIEDALQEKGHFMPSKVDEGL